uniref:Uncharacterized protein n=1 Tax=Vibrio alginolyticus TaxID=663 RepID=A0A1P8DPR9_VIBAL|nr:hypothetical protein [Vibrio alginolyticus]APU91096.1 hypothetical protein [Vibrio alginolyticus]
MKRLDDKRLAALEELSKLDQEFGFYDDVNIEAAVEQNPDLPSTFVKDVIEAQKEVAQNLTSPYKRRTPKKS